MDSTHSSIPFDPDFDAEKDNQTAKQQSQTQISGSIEGFGEPSYEPPGTSPVLTFYLGLACSVLLFGLAGVIWMLIVLS